MAASSSSCTTRGSQVWCNAYSYAELNGLTNNRLQQVLERMPAKELFPGLNQTIDGRPPTLAERMNWLDKMPYKQILEVCDAEHARCLLGWITDASMLSDPNAVHYVAAALTIMNKPDRFPIFVEAAKQSRSTYPGIKISDLLIAHYTPGNNPFALGLPPNILEVVRIEYKIIEHTVQCIRTASMALSLARRDLIEQCDGELVALMERVLKGNEEAPPPIFEELGNKV